jgi:hypothetical protein
MVHDLINSELAALQKADLLLQEALGLLDAARRYDVSVHVDLALHQLRGTRHALGKHEGDTP